MIILCEFSTFLTVHCALKKDEFQLWIQEKIQSWREKGCAISSIELPDFNWTEWWKSHSFQKNNPSQLDKCVIMCSSILVGTGFLVQDEKDRFFCVIQLGNDREELPMPNSITKFEDSKVVQLLKTHLEEEEEDDVVSEDEIFPTRFSLKYSQLESQPCEFSLDQIFSISECEK